MPQKTRDMPLDARVADACWRRIGVEGDRSCPRLPEAVHCRNCPVFAAASGQLFDRAAPAGYWADWTRRLAEVEEPAAGEMVSLLVFRVGPEWLALDVHRVAEVVPARAIHRVPHRSDRFLLGLANIRGELHLCLSLAALLGIEASATDDVATPQSLLVTDDGQDRWVFPADEVEGVTRVPTTALKNLPDTVAKSPRHYCKALLEQDARRVGVLCESRLFPALERTFR